MSITKQILYIAKSAKAKELEQLLTILSQLNQNNPNCMQSAVYGCEDESTEFLLYEQWDSEKSFDTFKKSNMYKDFEVKSKELIKRVEVLMLD